MVAASSEGKDYVWVPNDPTTENVLIGGNVKFYITAESNTDVQFAFEILAPNGEDDSFYIQVDSGSAVTWHVPRSSSWQWNTFGRVYELFQGRHTLTVHRREDGTKLARVRIESGDAHFTGHSVPLHATATQPAQSVREDHDCLQGTNLW